jgi:hypothetical protein
MNLKVIVRSGLLAFIGCASLRATVIANAQVSLTSLQITPITGTFSLVSPWMATAFAQGQNSLGQLDQVFDGPGLTANATAMVTDVTATGSADANLLTAEASSMIDISGTGLMTASSTGQSSLTSMFMITGGTGSVNVQFTANVTRMIALSTDASGQFAEEELISSLLLDGSQVLFSHDLASIGPDSSFNMMISGAQTQTETLQFNTVYTLGYYSDDDTYPNRNGMIPEPATIWLIGVPLGLSIAGRRSRIFHRYF